MREDIVIEAFEDKISAAGKNYTRFKIGDSWISSFSASTILILKQHIGQNITVEIQLKDNPNDMANPYKNIIKYIGLADNIKLNDGTVEVNAPVENIGQLVDKNFKLVDKQNADYVKSVVDLFATLIHSDRVDLNDFSSDQMMDKAISLVKKAKEEFK